MSPCSTILLRYMAPIVVDEFSSKVFFKYLLIMLVLPTPELPIMTILTSVSSPSSSIFNFFVFFCSFVERIPDLF